jgi:hypothetical protein
MPRTPRHRPRITANRDRSSSTPVPFPVSKYVTECPCNLLFGHQFRQLGASPDGPNARPSSPESATSVGNQKRLQPRVANQFPGTSVGFFVTEVCIAGHRTQALRDDRVPRNHAPRPNFRRPEPRCPLPKFGSQHPTRPASEVAISRSETRVSPRGLEACRRSDFGSRWPV